MATVLHERDQATQPQPTWKYWATRSSTWMRASAHLTAQPMRTRRERASARTWDHFENGALPTSTNPLLTYYRFGHIVVLMSLSSSAFWILTSLANGRRHGYQILRETALLSDGAARLKPTTLYATLERLESKDLIRSDGQEVVDGRARRYYRITETGIDLLTAETQALERSVRAARASLSAARPRPQTARWGVA